MSEVIIVENSNDDVIIPIFETPLPIISLMNPSEKTKLDSAISSVNGVQPDITGNLNLDIYTKNEVNQLVENISNENENLFYLKSDVDIIVNTLLSQILSAGAIK